MPMLPVEGKKNSINPSGDLLRKECSTAHLTDLSRNIFKNNLDRAASAPKNSGYCIRTKLTRTSFQAVSYRRFLRLFQLDSHSFESGIYAVTIVTSLDLGTYSTTI